MAEEIKDLIEKIQNEGVKVAEEKARSIEEAARQKAREILEKAGSQAAGLIAEAKEQNARLEASTQAALRQAGRDFILGLKKEINGLLDKLITLRLRQALNPEEMAKIIPALIKDYRGKTDGEAIISLKKEDLEEMAAGFLSELKEEIKKGITLKPSEDILGGFIISYDGGKSYFDFTDQALAEYISAYLAPKLSQILKEANPK